MPIPKTITGTIIVSGIALAFTCVLHSPSDVSPLIPEDSTLPTVAISTVPTPLPRLEVLLLAELVISEETDDNLYVRSDYNHNRRDLCDTAGTDPYTGLRFETESCQVDHIVAAKEAHESGGHAWDRPTRRQFGDDPLNLVASRDCVNGSKGKRDPAEWSEVKSGVCGGAVLTTEGGCFWADRTIRVKHRYDLTVDTAELAALETALADCPRLGSVDD